MRNVGSLDRVIRIVLGLALLGAGVAYKAWWGAIGLVPLLTALIGFCPLYRLIGVRTCPVENRSAR
ncbi:MAG: DUF2892 domain-containing protein [Candidatus Eisenbacteria bacterium]